MRILVTGAAGFIGSHTTLELVEAGYDVMCIDNFSNSVSDDKGNAVSLLRVAELVGKPIPFERCDVCDLEKLDAVFAKGHFDGLIHLAALKAVGESVAMPYEYYSNNLIASLNLVKMCQKYNVKNFIFSSSATVYGVPKELPITESCPTGQGITNPYGQTKYMMEQILIDVGKAHPDWNIVLLRYFNPVGAHPSGRIGEDPRGIPNNLMPFVSQVAIGKLPVLKIFGDKWDTPDGTGVRDFIHIVDLARGHVKALDRIRKEGHIGTEIYNLGTGTGYSVKEMVAAFEKASDRKIPTEIGEPRTGDVAAVYCDPSLALKMLGWKAEFGLEEMSRDLWHWQSMNPNGFSQV
ncbi:hypothetical protein RB195_006058 [Necator americanus]|uniref:UDP-glucose 4-epimerase n=1 Tax=Necator americanus TaxID=51031 RepID=A0ABR1BQT6_NECAM